MDNLDLAGVFQEMADLLRIEGGQEHRSRAFARAATVIEKLPQPAERMLRQGTLARVPGIGPGAIERIKEILRTGTCFERQRLRAALPIGLRDMLKIRGVGPRTLRVIYAHLRIATIEELERAALDGRLARLPHIGQTTQERIYLGIQALKQQNARVPLPTAIKRGEAIAAALREVPGTLQVAVAGSARRGKETMKDLDILVAADDAAAVASRFQGLPMITDVLIRGTTRSSVRIHGDQQADLRVLPPESFGAGLHYFTGSKNHNIALRKRALRYGIRISDHGIFVRDTETRLQTGRTEDEIFAAVGLPFIPPEIREDMGEIEAAEQGRLPRLVEERDLRGELHLHTTYSDGAATLVEMVRAGRDLGLEYLAVTDHSYSVRGSLAAQVSAIRRLEAEAGLQLLAGVEVDIEPDGSLELPLDVLAGLDFVVASVHRQLDMDAAQMTRRLVAAMDSGVVDCLGHPTGRRFSSRSASDVDLDEVVRVAAQRGVALEISGQPDRMDLNDTAAKRAREAGATLALNSDAHSPLHLHHRRFALIVARRAWLEPGHVVNTWPAARLLERRRDRLRRSGLTVVARTAPVIARKRAQQPSPAPGSVAAGVGLGEQLDNPPYAPHLRARLEAFLRGDEDPGLFAALAERSDNPLQLALNLLVTSAAGDDGDPPQAQ